ncbi:MAG: metallophosphoesterase, partial [Thermoplasmata archaeon]
ADDLKIYVTHGSPRDEIFEYIFPDVEDSLLIDLSEIARADIVVMGHTHVPMERRVKNKIFLNPGSVGQPRDGDPRASFMIFDTGKREVIFRRVSYDIDSASRAILENDLPRFLAQRLYLGM